jgi:hypothetical protein
MPSLDPDNRMPEPRDIMWICSSLVVLVQRPCVSYAEAIASLRTGHSELAHVFLQGGCTPARLLV